MKHRHIWAAALLFLPSCQGVAPAYVQADRLTHDAIAPEFAAYVKADEKLAESQKARRLALLASWDERLRAAEKAAGK